MIKDLINSLKNNNDGFSFRKLMALLGFFLVAYMDFKYISSTNILDALIYHLIFILALLGLINLDKIIDAWSNKGK